MLIRPKNRQRKTIWLVPVLLQAFLSLPVFADEPANDDKEPATRPDSLHRIIQEIKTFQPLRRLSDKAILSPRKNSFDEAGAFNPTVQKLANGKYVMLYRGQDKEGISRIGIAYSKNGIDFKAEKEPVLSPELDSEKSGIEDPRLCRSLIDPDKWFLTATAYNRDDQEAQLALYQSADLKHWQRLGVIMPAKEGNWNLNWTKAGAIVPEKIDGKFWLYYLGDSRAGNETGIACSEDGIHWQDASDKPVLPLRPGSFDSKVAEPGPPPIITDEGILLLYNGADEKLCYRTGWALFDKKDPRQLIARSEKAIFEPEKSWEKETSCKEIYQCPNVVFVEGLVKDGDRYLIYYGAADSCIGVAESQLK